MAAGGYYLNNDDARRLRDIARRVKGGAGSQKSGPRHDPRLNTPFKLTTARTQTFLGPGGPFGGPGFDPIKLIYGGVQSLGGDMDYVEGLWYGEDAPAELGLWGVGRVTMYGTVTSQIFDGDEPVYDGDELVFDSSFGSELGETVAINMTGRWLWPGSLVTVLNDRWIIASDCHSHIIEEYDFGGAQRFYPADRQQVQYPHYSDELEDNRVGPLVMPDDYQINDPTGVRAAVLDDLETGETAYFVHVTGRTTDVEGCVLSLTCLGPGSGVAGEQGPPGDPGPAGSDGEDGEDGTLLTVMFAEIDDSDDVAFDDSPVNFKNGSTKFGETGTATGSFANPGCAGVHEQPVVLIGHVDTGWVAVPWTPNRIKAKVNVSGGVDPSDATFAFDTIEVIRGKETAWGGALAQNEDPARFWADNEEIELEQQNDKQWRPIKLTSATRAAFVTTQITAATAYSTPGSGAARYFDTSGWVGAAFTVRNWLPTTFDVDTIVRIDPNYPTPEVITGSCDTLTPPA